MLEKPEGLRYVGRAALFVSNRTFNSLWDNEGTFDGAFAQTLFNVTDPASGLGRILIGNESVSATLGPQAHTFRYTGDDFGCQLVSTSPNVRPRGTPPPKHTHTTPLRPLFPLAR